MNYRYNLTHPLFRNRCESLGAAGFLPLLYHYASHSDPSRQDTSCVPLACGDRYGVSVSPNYPHLGGDMDRDGCVAFGKTAE